KWPLVVNWTKEIQKQTQATPHGSFALDAIKVNTQDHYFFKPIDFNTLNPEKAESLASCFLGNPQDFTAILVGDFDEKEVERLTKRYLASLPQVEKSVLATPSASSFFPS